MATDARIRYTKYAIREAFFDLLKTKKLNQVTVTAICTNAQINRATFYKYYDNPFDLMDKLEAELLDGLQSAILTLPHRTVQSVLRQVLIHLRDEHVTYQILLSENGDNAFIDRVMELCYQENIRIIQAVFPDMEKTEQEWLFRFIGEGCSGLVSRWIEGGMKEDIDEMVSFVEKLVVTLNQHLR